MRNSQWTQVSELPGQYTQLRLFPPTAEEVLLARVNELDAKLERQRKGQFGKIGKQEKKMMDLEERLTWIEKGLCKPIENTCEIVEMAVM